MVDRARRLGAVLNLLAETGEITVADVTTTLHVSAATARRDLDTLAGQQLLTRTRGGASSRSVAYELPLRYTRDPGAVQKERIARAAAGLVEPGWVVALTGGTTSTTLAGVLGSRRDLVEESSRPNLTVVTNAINIAAQLIMRPQIKVVVTGGVVHAHSYELVGPYSDTVLEQVAADIAFLGVNGIDPEFGASVQDEGEARVNTLMAARARRAVVIADSSKIGRRAFATIGGSELFDTLITDTGISAQDAAAFRERGIDVIVAE